MKFKKVIKKVLLDPKHWLGWGITTAGLLGLFFLLGLSQVYTPFYRLGLVSLVIIGIDLFKHAWSLQ